MNMEDVELKKLKQKIIDYGYEDVIVFDSPSYATAFIGITNSNQAVYDYEKMIDYLHTYNNMDYEEAADFISYNSSFYYGEGYPIIINLLDY